jgi:hypothetical protein
MSEQKQDTLANFLVSALDMEDEISNSVYKDYIKQENWPKTLKPDNFRQIKEYLTVLIEDTRRHKKIIEGLIKQNDRNKKPE